MEFSNISIFVWDINITYLLLNIHFSLNAIRIYFYLFPISIVKNSLKKCWIHINIGGFTGKVKGVITPPRFLKFHKNFHILYRKFHKPCKIIPVLLEIFNGIALARENVNVLIPSMTPLWNHSCISVSQSTKSLLPKTKLKKVSILLLIL